MIDGMELYQETLNTLDDLESLTDQFRDDSLARDRAEHAYRIELTKAMASLDIAWSARAEYAKGLQNVAEKRFERDKAETLAAADKQAIFAKNRRVDTLRDMANREWGRHE